MKRTVIHLVRHGEVDNPAGIIYGRLTGFGLSALGRAMAGQAARSLAGRDISAIRSSPLQRAQETAGPIATQFGLTVGLDARLIEPANDFEGVKFGLGKGETLRRPASWVKLRNPVRPSWGEPYAEIAGRMRAVIAELRAEVRGHEGVCVSHQLAIWTARMSLLGNRLWHDPRSRQCALASVTSLVYDDDALARIDYHEPAAGLAAAGDADDVPGA